MRNVIVFIYLTCVTISGIMSQYNYEETDADIQNRSNDLRTLLFYKRLLQKLTNDELMDMADNDHLMIRKSQRSPSLRLRFGRSSPNSRILDPSNGLNSLKHFSKSIRFHRVDENLLPTKGNMLRS